MRQLVRSLIVVIGLALLPSMAWAQATLSGTVRDTSGAVLPGVTVEAASPVLIEKVRSTITEGNGQFTIVNLRPGTYTVTFTLPGFATVQQANIVLSGNGTTTVNAEMRVGGLEETVTVSGEAPVVDVQTATRQQVLDKETIDALPTGKMYSSLGQLLPSVTTNNQEGGGALGDTMASLTVHGSRTTDQRVMQNGVNTMTLQAGGNIGIAVPNPTAASEVTINTAGADAEAQTGGVAINYIPKDGGNNLSATMFYTGTTESLQGDNLTQRLKDKGLGAVSAVKKNQDFNPGVGGPIMKDRIWFYFTGRYQQAQAYAANAFYNANAFDPTKWTYQSNGVKAFNDSDWKDAQVRFTMQATPKNKVSFTYDQQFRCSCPGGPGTSGVAANRSAEASGFFRSPVQQLLHAEWNSPVSNNLLLEAVALHRTERWGFMDPQNAFRSSFISEAQQAAMSQMIAVTDRGFNYRSRNAGYNNTWVPNYFARAAVTYIKAGNNIKIGFNDVIGFHDQRDYMLLDQPVDYTFNGGVPTTITYHDLPRRYKSDQNHDLGLFAQDNLTMNRLTATLGLRFDYYKSSFQQQTFPSTFFVPNRSVTTFAAEDNINWKDLSPRLAAVYDVNGDGKTAIKVSLNRYVNGQTLNGLGRAKNPILAVQNTAARDWTDADHDFFPDCDLQNFAANGECGAVRGGATFGDPHSSDTFDSKLMSGFGNRNYNWELSAGVQREVMPRVSLDVSYFRRWYGNFQVTDNTQRSAADMIAYTLTVPAISGLSTAGQTLTFRDALAGTGLQNNNTVTNDVSENWQGVDVNVNTRLQNGVFLQAGVSTGSRHVNYCGLVDTIPEALHHPDFSNIWLPAEYCDMKGNWLTQFKANGSYTIPVADVRVSGTFQSIPGPEVRGDLRLSSADFVSLTGHNRVIEGTTFDLATIKPFTQYGERLNTLDLRLSKLFRLAGTRTSVNFDIFNLFNVDTITLENNLTSAYRAPQGIVLGRYLKIGAQFDF